MEYVELIYSMIDQDFHTQDSQNDSCLLKKGNLDMMDKLSQE